MAEAQLRQFLEKVRQLNAFVALSEADPSLWRQLCDCDHHDQVVALARGCGFEIGRRWGEPPIAAGGSGADEASSPAVSAAVAPAPAELPRLAAAAGSADLPRDQGLSVGFTAPGFGSEAVPAGRSLLDAPCPAPGEERHELLLQTPSWRLLRIHSCAAASPEGFWYDQQECEWLTLLQGTAGLRFAGEGQDRRLLTGDSLVIAAGQRHRVTFTDPDPGTVWLALFWREA